MTHPNTGTIDCRLYVHSYKLQIPLRADRPPGTRGALNLSESSHRSACRRPAGVVRGCGVILIAEASADESLTGNGVE